MAQKPSIPKGTRDFNSETVAKRSYIIETIKQQFQVYGFQPIETPSFENSETLMGKYGEEGDRLIFKIIDSGSFYEKNLEFKIENSISIYLAVTYIFKDLVLAILDDITARNVQFLSKDELIEYIKDKDLLAFINYKIDEWGSFIIDDYELSNKFKIKLKEDSTKLLNTVLYFINQKGLDFDIRRDNREYVNNQLKWADRRILKEYVQNTFEEFFTESKYNNDFTGLNSLAIAHNIADKALRYDLTVPFARYVVQHQNEIDFPFKRYQIQPVWRADRPQKGRFREFYQCDADVVGSNSLFQEVEFIQLYDGVFTALNLNGVTIKINNRKILSGIAEVIGAQDKLIDFTVALDKLDKIGEEKVKEEMLSKGIPKVGIEKLQPLFGLTGDFSSQIESLKQILSTSELGLKGIKELEFINTTISNLGLKTAILQLDVTLARGLNYYTGAIFEVSSPKGVKMGSIGGGGRYDDLTSIFGKPDTSGVGISFGLDRIYLVLEELGLFPESVKENTKVLFISFGKDEALESLKALTTLRNEGISAELYPDWITSGKQMKKQMNYANKREIPFVVLVGEEELKANVFTLKNMSLGEQQKLQLEDLIETLK